MKLLIVIILINLVNIQISSSENTDNNEAVKRNIRVPIDHNGWNGRVPIDHTEWNGRVPIDPNEWNGRVPIDPNEWNGRVPIDPNEWNGRVPIDPNEWNGLVPIYPNEKGVPGRDCYYTVGRNFIFFDITNKVGMHHVATIQQMKESINQILSRNDKYPEVSVTLIDLKKAVREANSVMENIKKERDLKQLFLKIEPAARKIPGLQNDDLRVFGACLSHLQISNDENNDNLREEWARVWMRQIADMTLENQEFETFLNSLIKKVDFDINEVIEKSMLSFATSYSSETNRLINAMIEFNDDGLRGLKKLKNCQILVSKLSEASIRGTNLVYVYDTMKLVFASIETFIVPETMVNLVYDFRRFVYLLDVNDEVFDMPSTWKNTFKASADQITQLFNNFFHNIVGASKHFRPPISLLIDNVCQSIRQHYAVQAQNLKSNVELLQIDQNQIQMFRDDINGAIEAMKTLVYKIGKINEAISLGHLIDEINNDLRLNLSPAITDEIKKKCAYLDSLRDLTRIRVWIGRSWADEFYSTLDYLKNIQNEVNNYKPISDLRKEIEIKMEKLMEDFAKSLDEYHREKLSVAKAEIEHLALESDLPEVIALKVKEIAFNLISGLTIMSGIITHTQNPSGLKSTTRDRFTNLRQFYNNKNYLKIISFQVEILKFSLVESKINFKTPEAGWSIPIQNESSNNFEKFLNEFKNNFLNQIPQSVMVLMKSDLVAEAKNIIDYYEHTLSPNETDEALEIFSKIENSISDLLSATRNENYDNLFSYLNNAVDSVIALDVDQTIINNILHRYTYFEKEQVLNENQLISLKPFNNFLSLENMLMLLIESPIWNAFLLELDEKLSQYEFQSDVSKYNVSNLDDWGKVNKPRGISIDKNNFHQFLDKLNIKGGIRNIELTDSRLRDLDHVLAITLRNTYKEIIDEDKIILHGRFIKFSDFVDKNDSFRDLSKFNSRNVSIFATKTLFIDRSISHVGNELNISLIAPQWEVVGERHINVAGKSGGPIFLRAGDGPSTGEKGGDGREGLPGGAAGNFFGIGKVFVNGERLTITADGGKGGRGQDGGHGAKGGDGRVVTIEQLTDPKLFVSSLLLDGEFISIPVISVAVDDIWDRAKKYSYEVDCKKSLLAHSDKDAQPYICSVWDKKSGRGGDGGIGGPGGVGGKAGKVEIEEVGLGEIASGIRIYNANGEDGARGRGGYGGEGGTGNNLTLDYIQWEFYSHYWRSYKVSIKLLKNEPNAKGSDGDRVYEMQKKI